MNKLKDELIWTIIGGKGFCSFKYKARNQNLCRNEYNVTGFCSKQSCPISNSNYATIVGRNGEIFLYLKDATNTRFPDKLWKKFKLSRNFIKSFQEIDLILNLWPKFFVFKTKQKMTKLWQIFLRDKLRKVKKRSLDIYQKTNILYYKTKESKLVRQIKYQNLVEKQLLHRFNLGIYGQLYRSNFIQTWRQKAPHLKYSKLSIEEMISDKKSEKLKTIAF